MKLFQFLAGYILFLMIVFLIIIIFGGCSYSVIEWYDISLPGNPRFSNLEEAEDWINDNLEYEEHYYNGMPQHAIDRGKVDCRERTLILLAIAYNQFGKKGKWILQKKDFAGHMVSEIEQKRYFEIDGYKDIREIDFDDIWHEMYKFH